MSDLISRQAVLESLKTDYSLIMFDSYGNLTFTGEHIIEAINRVPSVEPERNPGHCKECKYFEYDSVAKVNGMSLIVAHEICKRWGDGCKTKEDGYCFLYEPQESEEV